MLSRSTLALGAALALLAAAGTAQAAVAFALTRDSGTLVRFDTSMPGTVTTVGMLSGATDALDGIDFRPADGMLYGYRASTSGIYRVDTTTGATTLMSTSTAPVTTPLGIDFNPVPDRLRVVTAGDASRRINVTTGAALIDGALAYNAGDANFGIDPMVVDAAYTNHDRDPGTGTTLYYIDSFLGVLATTSNPNAGLLDTVGALGVAIEEFLGFDIFTDADASNTAYASLRVAGVQGLYTINLGSGEATLVGAIGADALRSLAVAPIPEPGSLALLAAAGLGALGAVRRRAATARRQG